MAMKLFKFGQQDPKDVLLNSVRENKVNIIKDITDKNPNLINYVYKSQDHCHNKTIIQIAVCDFADTITKETVDLLIKQGADLSFSVDLNRHKETLHYAALGQRPDILQLVLENITDVNVVTRDDDTALHLLIRDDDKNESQNIEDCLDVLLKRSDIVVNKPDSNNITPIEIAIRKKYKHVVQKFLNSGKDVNIDKENSQGKIIRNLIEDLNKWPCECPRCTLPSVQ